MWINDTYYNIHLNIGKYMDPSCLQKPMLNKVVIAERKFVLELFIKGYFYSIIPEQTLQL